MIVGRDRLLLGGVGRVDDDALLGLVVYNEIGIVVPLALPWCSSVT